jgi:hypothetical protein
MRPTKLQNQSHDNEPESLRALSKAKLYQQLAEQYLLPNLRSRAITRDYLIGVHTGKYFRVSLSDIHKFQADITPKLMKKALFVNVAETIQKVDALLLENDRPKLGFMKGYMPDTQWLYQVARFVDPCNVTAIFQYPIKEPGASTISSEKVLMAQQAAEKALLGDNGLLGKRHIMDSLRELCDKQRQLKCRERELNLLDKKGEKLLEKIKNDRLEVERSLISSSRTILSELNKNIERDVSDEYGKEETRKLLKVKEV